MKLILLIAVFLFGLDYSMAAQNNKGTRTSENYASLITAEGLSSSLHFIASDFLNGRGSGTRDEKFAAEFLANSYILLNIPALKTMKTGLTGSYFQSFEYLFRNTSKSSQNVIAVIEGSDPILKNEAIILIAHYDHLGQDTSLKTDQIFNGAADDGSGTVALLQMAKTFATAKANGDGPKRTIIFFHAGAEEEGSNGSYFYVNQNPLWPLEKTRAVINMDGIGGIDVTNLGNNTNYIYVLHTDSTSADLFEIVKQVNKKDNLKLDILYPKNAQLFTSDDRPFGYYLVPAIYFSSGLTEHYHKVSDEAATIDYKHMTKVARLVFSFAWELSMNRITPSSFKRSTYVQVKDYYVCPPCKCSKDGNFVFDKYGKCDVCKMYLIPVWEKKGN